MVSMNILNRTIYEYIIRAMNTKHAQFTRYTHSAGTKPNTYGFSCSRLHIQLKGSEPEWSNPI